MPAPRINKLALCSAAGLIFFATLLAHLTGCGGGSTTPPPPPPPLAGQKIQHIVIIFQENRTPDNLFHGLPNADIADSGVNSLGQVIPLTPIALANDYDLSHAHTAFVNMYDGGKMDGADKIHVSCKAGATNCPPPNPQFQYVNPSDVQPYFQLAEQYTFGDRMFQTNQGPSFPAHQFVIAGTSAPTTASNLFASENVVLPPTAGTNTAAGCAGPAGETVALIDPFGSEATACCGRSRAQKRTSISPLGLLGELVNDTHCLLTIPDGMPYNIKNSRPQSMSVTMRPTSLSSGISASESWIKSGVFIYARVSLTRL